LFEIGNSLREARERRGIDFARAEAATKIRGKYLRALEEEQFDVLPAETYVKGFLRTYAEFLGLDGQLYVDEFNSRFVSGEEREARARRTRKQPDRHRRVETGLVLAVLAAIAIVTVVVISAWSSSGGSKTPPKATPAVRTHHAIPLLTVIAKRGSTHVTARQGGASGDIAFDGTIQKGDAPVAIRGTRLWVQIDAPENLHVIVKGHTQVIPGHAPRVIVVTAHGWRPVG
jgi:cytoskeletal protein RodZ